MRGGTGPAPVSRKSTASAATAATPASAPVTSATRQRRISPTLAGALISVGSASFTLGIGAGAWWIGEDLEPFHWRRTGAFGPDTYAGGADKVGHMIGHYYGTKILIDLYDRVGVEHKLGVGMASAVAFTIGNGIESFDAITHFGFEYGDVIANTIGIGVAAMGGLVPDFDNAFGFRIGYLPSKWFLRHEKNYLTVINDYTGMVYYADLKLKGLIELFGADPGWGRFLLAGVNWNTQDYSPGPRTPDERAAAIKRRNLGFHVGVSLPEVLERFLPDTWWRQTLATFSRYYAIPLTTVSFVRDLDSGQSFVRFTLAARLEFPL